MSIIPVVNRTLIAALVMCSFAASNASAQIIDRRDWGSSEIRQVKTQLNDVLKAVNKGKDQISPDLRDTLIGNLSVLDMLPSKAEVNNWTASGACASFKTNYSALLDEAFLALRALPEYARNPVFFQPDIFPDVIDQVPCNLLYPVAQVMEGTPILDGTLSDQLATATMALDEVKDISFASDLLDSDNGSVDSKGGIKLGAICEFNADNRGPIQVAKSAISGSAVLAKFVGVALEAKSTTSLKQVKGGVHGYVGAHVEVDYYGKFGKVFNGLAAFMSAVSGSVTVNTRFCDLREQNIALQRDVRSLTDNQKEIIRLLLTPQGRRRTAICLESEEECGFPHNGG